MASGAGDDGDGPEKRPPAGSRRRPTPPPGSRTPPPRTRGGDRREVEHRAINRERSRGSVFSRVLGRSGLDDAIEERFQPYGYQSSRPILRWLFLSLLLFIVVGAVSVFIDVGFRNAVNEWQDDGFTEIPIDPEDVAQGTLIAELEFQDPETVLCNESELASASVIGQGCRSIERVARYAASEGLQCTTLEELSSVVSLTRPPAPDCDTIVDISTRFDDLNSRSNIVSIFAVLFLIIVAFPFSSFTHRSSRNLRTMKSDGQKHSPDGTVIRFFIPILNIYKPLFMFNELFKASDPRVSEGDTELWRKKGRVSPVSVLWALSWGAVLIFNPITVARIFFKDRAELSDVSSATFGLIAADILIIVLGVLAILMSNTLSKWQDLRAAKVGTITVTPPRPRDPLEKALEEGIRRQDKINAANRDRSSKRRKK